VVDEGLTAGTVARRLGVAVTTLRTWHQRYGLGPSRHVRGKHRRYTLEDLARLEVMRRLTAEGVTPADAARWARQAPSELLRDPAQVREAALKETPRGRAGGGFTIPVGRAAPAARGLARAAAHLDSATMRDILQRSIEADGVVSTWDNVLLPVLIGIGERHRVTRQLVDVEHLLSRTASEVLGAVPRPMSATTSARILLACADEEQHSLPLEAMAAALAQVGVAFRMLGARVPPPALIDSVSRTRPAVVMLWSQTADTADIGQLQALLIGRGRPLLVLAGGPGWNAESLPAEVVAPTRLSDAMHFAVAAANPDQMNS
jgi:MerR family transcriptional regulator, light-induced transcriptional regulator